MDAIRLHDRLKAMSAHGGKPTSRLDAIVDQLRLSLPAIEHDVLDKENVMMIAVGARTSSKESTNGMFLLVLPSDHSFTLLFQTMPRSPQCYLLPAAMKIAS